MADVSQIKLPNGSVYDLIDEKSGYITAEYIENKTDYSIPVSRVGEIVVGETAIGTNSTNFPTSKAVVDYVDERVVQEMDAIDVGVTGIKADGRSLSVVDGVVNIPVISSNQSIGLMTQDVLDTFANYIQSSIPTSTSQLNNDSGFITSETDPVFSASAAAGITSTDISNWNAKSDTDEKLKTSSMGNNARGNGRGYSDGRYYYPEPYYYGDAYSRGMRDYGNVYPRELRDYREGRSGNSRRMYMESKEMHEGKEKQMMELEKYMKELSGDMIEMINDATPEEKEILSQKLSTLAEKIK